MKDFSLYWRNIKNICLNWFFFLWNLQKKSTNQVARAQASSSFILRASSRIREMRLSLLDGVVTFYNNIPFSLDYCWWNELSKPPSYGETCRNVTLSFRSAQSAAPLLQKWACVTRRVGKDDCGATTTDHNWQMLRKRLISAKVTQTALSTIIRGRIWFRVVLKYFLIWKIINITRSTFWRWERRLEGASLKSMESASASSGEKPQQNRKQ